MQNQDRIIEKATQMYTSGSSLIEVASTLQIPRTTLRDTLVRAGVGIRPPTKKANGRVNGFAPYGYVLDRGALIFDPREQKVVRKIMAYWNKGTGFREIARTLDGQGIKSRTGKTWSHAVIKSVIERHKDQII